MHNRKAISIDTQKFHSKNSKVYKGELTPAIKMNIDLFQSPNYIFSSEPVSQSSSPQKVQLKNAVILDELGFASNLESHPLACSNFERKLTRRASICVSDFWTSQEKEKFLKKKGFWEAYKKIQTDDKALVLVSTKSSRLPSLPHVMDFNAKRRIEWQKFKNSKPQIKSQKSFPKNLSSSPNKPKNSAKNNKIAAIDSLVSKCDDLAFETSMLKDSTDKFKMNFFYECEKNIGKEKFLNKKKKISRHELHQIKTLLEKLN